jgi:phospholipid/cholesterol/gamma-HCH transport system permease protein
LATSAMRIQSGFFRAVEALGNAVMLRVELLGRLVLLAVRAIGSSFDLLPSQRAYIARIVRTQIYFTGCQAISLVSWLGVAVGAVILFYACSDVAAVRSSEVSVRLLYLVAVKEIGPLVCALIIIARSGTAVASEIGSMKVNQEMDGLRAVGILPDTFIVLPRIVGGVISQFCLVILFSVMAMVGGYLVALVYQPMTVGFFFICLADLLSISDFVIFGLKAIGTGCIVFSSACFFGLKVEKSSHEIPQYTTRAVVTAIGGVLFWCVFLSFVHLNFLSGGGL